MNLGEWDSAVIKSIWYVGLGIAFYYLFTGLMPSSIDDVLGLIVTFFLYIGVYLIISILGWLLIGFPIHWLASKYTNGAYFFYIILPLVFVVGCLFYKGSLLLGLAALFQAAIFRYYVHKKT